MNSSGASAAADWCEAVITGRHVPDPAEVTERFGPRLVAALGPDSLAASLGALAEQVSHVSAADVSGAEFRLELIVAGRAWEICGQVDDVGRIVDLTEGRLQSRDLRTRVLAGPEVGDGERLAMHRLFDLAYRDADHHYLDHSIARLGTAGLGYRGDELIAFAVGGRRVVDLPLVGPTRILMAGLCCVHPGHRR